MRNNCKIDEDEHNSKIEYIISKIDNDEYKEWLIDRLRYSNEPSLSMRLKEIFKEVDFIISLNSGAVSYTHLETKNFTTASEILSVTQPALSKAISKLEEELDVKLFQREGRNIKITEYGDVFLKYAKGALSEVEKGKLKLKEMKNNSDTIISISSTACIGAIFIPFLISGFFNNNSKVKFNIDNQNTDEILKGIKNNHIDFGFISNISDLGKYLSLIHIYTYANVPRYKYFIDI